MKGCPLSQKKFQGNCATCAQLSEEYQCVFLDILKKVEEMRTELRELQHRVGSTSK